MNMEIRKKPGKRKPAVGKYLIFLFFFFVLLGILLYYYAEKKNSWQETLDKLQIYSLPTNLERIRFLESYLEKQDNPSFQNFLVLEIKKLYREEEAIAKEYLLDAMNLSQQQRYGEALGILKSISYEDYSKKFHSLFQNREEWLIERLSEKILLEWKKIALLEILEGKEEAEIRKAKLLKNLPEKIKKRLSQEYFEVMKTLQNKRG